MEGAEQESERHCPVKWKKVIIPKGVKDVLGGLGTHDLQAFGRACTMITAVI